MNKDAGIMIGYGFIGSMLAILVFEAVIIALSRNGEPKNIFDIREMRQTWR
jgi:hypothetical protein